MKYLLIFILQFIFCNLCGQCDQIDNWQKGFFDPACCEDNKKLAENSMTQADLIKSFYNAKCLVWNKEFLNAIKDVGKLTGKLKMQTEFSDFEDQSINNLYFQTLLLGFELSKISLDYYHREKYQSEINRLICNDERVLIEYIEKFIFSYPNLKIKIEKILSHFDFYLSYINLENCNQNKADELLKSLLKRVGYSEILFKHKTDKFIDRNFIFSGSIANVEVYFQRIKYIIFAPKSITRESLIAKNYECDTITIFDYFPLEQWKEHIFLSYYIKEKEDNIFNDLVQSINLAEVLRND